jgi:hypothetical protein
MRSNRRRADAKLERDLVVAVAMTDPPKHVEFAARKRV